MTAERPPLQGGALALTAFAVALGAFMQVLDTTIANVSVPTIAGDLGVSADEGTWVITSFAVANGIGVPVTGWLMQRYGIVRVFVTAVLLFAAASFLCGIAWSLGSLILFRILQGATSGPLNPGSQALLLMIFPQRRNLALAIWSGTAFIGPVAGPVLGGYISDNWSWPWIFLINVPVGLTAAAICWRSLGRRDTPTRKLPIDRIGFLLLVLWVGSLQIMLDKGKDADWFAAPTIGVLAAIAATAFVAWVIWEATEPYPIVDLKLFRLRSFACGTFVFCVGYAFYLGNVVLLPLWLQTQLGYTATWAGLVMAPTGVIAVIATPIGGRLMARADARWTASISFVFFAACYFLRGNFTPDVDATSLMIASAVLGVGPAFFFSSMVSIALRGIPPARTPSASSLNAFARMTAGSFAVSIVTTLWDRREALHQSRLVEKLTPADPAMAETTTTLHGLGLSDLAATGAIMRSVVSQAYTIAATDLFQVSAWLCLAMIPIIWLAGPVKKAEPTARPTAAAD
jgi:DHA2 family multidrug resistance protein